MSFRLLINSGNFVAKLVFARRIFPTLGNANEFPLLSLNGKIAMPKTTYQISLKGHVGGIDFVRSDVDAVLAENEGKQVNVLIDSLGGSLPASPSLPPSVTTAKWRCISSDSMPLPPPSLRLAQYTSPSMPGPCISFTNSRWPCFLLCRAPAAVTNGARSTATSSPLAIADF